MRRDSSVLCLLLFPQCLQQYLVPSRYSTNIVEQINKWYFYLKKFHCKEVIDKHSIDKFENSCKILKKLCIMLVKQIAKVKIANNSVLPRGKHDTDGVTCQIFYEYYIQSLLKFLQLMQNKYACLSHVPQRSPKLVSWLFHKYYFPTSFQSVIASQQHRSP